MLLILAMILGVASVWILFNIPLFGKTHDTSDTQLCSFFKEKHLKLVGVKSCAIDVIIDYTDGKKENSQRCVRIEKVGAYDLGWVYLQAYCYTTKAQRVFAADRITAFISDDGVRIPPRVYLTETLKLPLLKREIRLRDRSTYGR